MMIGSGKLVLRRLMKLFKGPDPRRAIAAEEMAACRATAFSVFAANLKHLLSDGNLLSAAILQPYGYEEINVAFLWGVTSEFILARPDLPTDPHDRARLYVWAWHADKCDGRADIEAGRAAAQKASVLAKSGDLFIDAVIEEGRRAYRDQDPTHLHTMHHEGRNRALWRAERGQAWEFLKRLPVQRN